MDSSPKDIGRAVVRWNDIVIDTLRSNLDRIVRLSPHKYRVQIKWVSWYSMVLSHWLGVSIILSNLMFAENDQLPLSFLENIWVRSISVSSNPLTVETDVHLHNVHSKKSHVRPSQSLLLLATSLPFPTIDSTVVLGLVMVITYLCWRYFCLTAVLRKSFCFPFSFDILLGFTKKKSISRTLRVTSLETQFTSNVRFDYYKGCKKLLQNTNNRSSIINLMNDPSTECRSNVHTIEGTDILTYLQTNNGQLLLDTQARIQWSYLYNLVEFVVVEKTSRQQRLGAVVCQIIFFSTSTQNPKSEI